MQTFILQNTWFKFQNLYKVTFLQLNYHAKVFEHGLHIFKIKQEAFAEPFDTRFSSLRKDKSSSHKC